MIMSMYIYVSICEFTIVYTSVHMGMFCVNMSMYVYASVYVYVCICSRYVP